MQQTSFLDPIDITRRNARETAKKLARARGERMANLAAEKVDYLHAQWVQDAVQKLRQLAKRIYPGMFSIETARLAINFPVPEGGDLRVLGKVTTEALRLEYIECVPGRFVGAASSNGSPKGMYRAGRNA